MTGMPSIIKTCKPRREFLTGELPDAFFAADLWQVFAQDEGTHEDYADPARFFGQTHPTVNLKLLVKDIAERLSGVGGSPIYRLETGFGGGKSHSLIACVHLARHGRNLARVLESYDITDLPASGETRIAAFVGEESDPINGTELEIEDSKVRAFTPWGQIALLTGGLSGYERIQQNDQSGVVPGRTDLRDAMGDKPVLIVIDELVHYMARVFALPPEHPRARLNSQWNTFFQVLFGIAASRPRTALLLTLPSEKDASRVFVGELKQHLASALEIVQDLIHTTGRQVPCIDPTQSFERAAILVRRLFDSVDTAAAADVANEFARYYQKQQDEGAQIDPRAFQTSYINDVRSAYPFHPELIRLFAERLADIPQFHGTRGALRLFARTIRAVWERKDYWRNAPLFQAQHIDLSRSDIRSEVLQRLNRTAFERGLDADVIKAQETTHASEVEAGWPWKAATESASVVFLHSLPDGSKGVTPGEVALAIGRPGHDLGYVSRGLEETERRGWYMRREGDHYLFRTRASVNKRFHERLSQVQPGEVRETLDNWVQEVYSGFSSFQVIPFPVNHTGIKDTADRLRLVIVHFDKECGAVGGGDRLNFTKSLFSQQGVNAGPRHYRNNLVFLLAESTRIDGLKEAVRALISWERVQKDINTEQELLAGEAGVSYRSLKEMAKRGDSGVPAEFMSLENDLLEVKELGGTQELNVRTKLLEAYRVLAFARGAGADELDIFSQGQSGPLLECFRVDFGETPDPRRARRPREAVAEAPILQCLRDNSKLVPEPTPESPMVLAPDILRKPPMWPEGTRRLSTEDVWDRLRREPELPMIVKQTDLLPTLRAGVVKTPDALWVYYNQAEKRVYTRENTSSLSPVIAKDHYLYEPAAALADRIMPVAELSPQEVWDHFWPREGTAQLPTVPTAKLLEGAFKSTHFPVMPERNVIWQALQEGARENRWILFLRGPNLPIGSQEMSEWPGTPRFDDSTELWSYQAALDEKIYPRQKKKGDTGLPLTAANLKAKCWPGGAEEVTTEDLERFARSIWPEATRPQIENVLRDGVREGVWCAWQKAPDEVFYTSEDAIKPAVQVSAAWSLVAPGSALAQKLDSLRPGRGPQPVTCTGTPREALIQVWERLGEYPNVRLAKLSFAVVDRDSFDNTLLATWADRPPSAQARTSLSAHGSREVNGQSEQVALDFEGRLEEVRGLMAPIWPFRTQGELHPTIGVTLTFQPPVLLDDPGLTTYRTAIMNANQGTLEVTATPIRAKTAAGTQE